MKKLVLIASVMFVVTSCNKSDVSDAQSKLDSTSTVVNEKIDAVSDIANSVLDSSQVRIKDIQGIGEDAQKTIEETKKMVDSVSEKLSNIKLESKIKTDSAKKEIPQVIVNVPTPKVVKETKIVYKDHPKAESPKPVEADIVKRAAVNINVENLNIAKESLLDQVHRYDGYVKTEDISNNNGWETGYFVINLPTSKFDYFIDDISSKIGKIDSKNIETTGTKNNESSISRIEINLFESNKAAGIAGKPKGFGGKFTDGISSGWEVLTTIFLFLIPFWPLYLIAGIGYYFYKKKNTKEVNS